MAYELARAGILRLRRCVEGECDRGNGRISFLLDTRTTPASYSLSYTLMAAMEPVEAHGSLLPDTNPMRGGPRIRLSRQRGSGRHVHEEALQDAMADLQPPTERGGRTRPPG